MERFIPDVLAAAEARYGERPFLVCSTGAETFAQAASSVRRVASALEQRGVEPGDRVLIQAANSAQLVHAWLGAIELGAIPAAVNVALTPHELTYLREDLEPRLFLADAERLGQASGLGAIALEPLATEAAAKATSGPAHRSSAGPAAIVYTSGTTSRPKGVLVRHAAYVLTGESVPSWFALGEEECLWTCLPLFHINAQAYSLMTALVHGYRLALSARFTASRFWAEAARLEATETNVIGAMLVILSRQPPETWVPSPLRTMYATPALDVAQRRALERRFGVRIVTGYGMTESPFGCIESSTSRHKEASVGRPRQHPSGQFVNRLRVVTNAGALARTGEVGELQLQNPAVTHGYWNAPEITARALADGWLHTGDSGFVDADGDVTLVGRTKTMIRRRGENIAPQEVEDVLLMHPAVELACVVGVPSDLSEEEVAAAVVPAPGACVSADELAAFCADRLAPFKIPNRFVLRSSLPMGPTMRVSRELVAADVAVELAAGEEAP